MGIINIESYKAIQEVKSKYCRLMDTKQWQDWGKLFAEDIYMDVSDDVTSDLGNPIVVGRDAVVALVSGMVGNAITVHQVHSPEIDFSSDSTADVIWAMSDVVVWPEGVTPPDPTIQSLEGYGHYHEIYKCIDGEWKIAKLKLTRLYRKIN